MPELETEREVVETLLTLVPTEVLPRSLRHGDPTLSEPDIIGRTDSGAEVGFEVTEVIDEDLAPSDPEASAVAAEMLAVFERLTRTASGEHLPQGVTVFVEFETRVGREHQRPSSRHEKRQIIVRVVTDLLDRGRSFTGRVATDVAIGSKTIMATVEVIASPFRSCSFDCSESVPFEVPLIERIEGKLAKSYESSRPLHLVAFFRLSPYFNMDYWTRKIKELIRQDTRATRFSAIHVLDVPRRLLLLSERTGLL